MTGGVAGPSGRARGRGAALWARSGPGGGVGVRVRVGAGPPARGARARGASGRGFGLKNAGAGDGGNGCELAVYMGILYGRPGRGWKGLEGLGRPSKAFQGLPAPSRLGHRAKPLLPHTPTRPPPHPAVMMLEGETSRTIVSTGIVEYIFFTKCTKLSPCFGCVA